MRSYRNEGHLGSSLVRVNELSFMSFLWVGIEARMYANVDFK